jgi:hypothetical protein
VGREPEGPVTRRVRAAIRQLRAKPGLDELGEARAALAVRMAKSLDDEAGPKEVPQLSKELRACLTDLAGEVRGDDDDLRQLLSGLRPEVRHSQN